MVGLMMSNSTQSQKSLAAELGELLQSKSLTVTCAESCTGGGIASAITDIPGSSQWFHMGFVTYANQSKQQLLGVAPDVIAQEGAVSQAVVEDMALGALNVSSANIAVAVSGVAGPGGGSEDKPVGLVWFCWAKSTGSAKSGDSSPVVLESRSCQFEGGRSDVRVAAIQQALVGLISILKK